ncbi:DNA-binding protein HU [Candidatus Xiphinematobacter sp. Idaho Grape]|uniref:HU family DNA-binding protein n=1 Tax=Candidatus Xiphinematobacter sp. Idaho Grape TaxID=1704307 RepID=UPI000705EEA7|nr:HU family DNA-binding protein [Candidatus Xiphinematobacter sp. Idaho Grape]ALJ56366.1 DNA-binding protein HU [Candidatus Xiphinematobacter sp. Idaho Grape]
MKLGNLTKRSLVLSVSEELNLVQQDVSQVIQKTLDYIVESLAKGQDVELRNFGVFEVKLTKARIGRNPNKPEIDVVIPARATVKFRPGRVMQRRVMLRTEKLKKNSNERD